LEKRTRATFNTPDDLRAKVILALHQWLAKHPEYRPAQLGPLNARPYLEWLRDQTATIYIRGLSVGSGKAQKFPIEDLYIPLTTASETGRQPMELQESLTHRRLMIVGDPGSGKTTFLRRVIYALAAQNPASAGLKERLLSLFRPRREEPFPLFIRIADLTQHIDECRRQSVLLARAPESPEWLAHFLATRSAGFGWGLDEDFFTEKLSCGSAVVLLDGLDEAPNREQREQAARLFENATSEYQGCRFVVTTRPQSYSGDALLADFREARIEPLTPEAVETFLERWCAGLFPESRKMAEEHRKELSEAFRAWRRITACARKGRRSRSAGIR
jgi:predicted NACHT family NTPase